jgi:hypothetical protein
MSLSNALADKYRRDSRPTEGLLRLALTTDADRDDDAYWQPIAVLQHRLPEILDLVAALGDSPDDKRRDTAATILGQGRVGTKFNPERCADVLLRMLAREQSIPVLTAISFALGHLHDVRAVGPLVRLQAHADARVRYAVVSSLGGQDEPAAIAALIERCADPNRDVRNWATFGLGSQIDTDSPAIRAALLARLTEEDDEIRGEALVGLARRGDVRVAAALLHELETQDKEILCDWMLIAEAAEAVIVQAEASGAQAWLPVLAKLSALGLGDYDQLQAALNRCTPSEP